MNWELHLTVFHILFVFVSMPTDTFTVACMPPFLCLISIEQTIVRLWMSYLHLQERVGCWLGGLVDSIKLSHPDHGRAKRKSTQKVFSFCFVYACVLWRDDLDTSFLCLSMRWWGVCIVEMNKWRYKQIGE